jgi:hypothetical protein
LPPARRERAVVRRSSTTSRLRSEEREEGGSRGGEREVAEEAREMVAPGEEEEPATPTARPPTEIRSHPCSIRGGGLDSRRSNPMRGAAVAAGFGAGEPSADPYPPLLSLDPAAVSRARPHTPPSSPARVRSQASGEGGEVRVKYRGGGRGGRRGRARWSLSRRRRVVLLDLSTSRLLTVYFGAPSMFITLWFGFDYGTNPPLGTLII